MKNFLLVSLGFLFFIISCTSSETSDTKEIVDTKNDSPLTNQYLDSLIKENPKDADLYFQRAKENFNNKIYPAAMADIYSAMVLDSSKAEYYYLAGDLFLEMGEGEKAIQTAATGIANIPEDEQMYLMAAEYNLMLGNHAAAINFLNDLLTLNKYNAEAYFLKGMVYKEVGDTTKAISNYQTATEQDPTFYNAYMQLGLLHTALENDLAIQYFENALRIDSLSREAMYGKAYYFQKTKNFQKAIEEYKKMLVKDAKDHQIFFNIGHTYLDMDSLEKSYKNFNIATQIQPNYAGAFYMKGFVAEKMGNNEIARKSYEQALNMLPDNEEVQNALKRVQ